MHGPHVGPDRLRDFEYYRCADTIYSPIRGNLSEVCRLYHYSIGSYLHNGGYGERQIREQSELFFHIINLSVFLACECDSTGSYSSLCNQIDGYCSCKPNVVGRRCNTCAPGTYGFGPEGCKGTRNSYLNLYFSSRMFLILSLIKNRSWRHDSPV